MLHTLCREYRYVIAGICLLPDDGKMIRLEAKAICFDLNASVHDAGGIGVCCHRWVALISIMVDHRSIYSCKEPNQFQRGILVETGLSVQSY